MIVLPKIIMKLYFFIQNLCTFLGMLTSWFPPILYYLDAFVFLALQSPIQNIFSIWIDAKFSWRYICWDICVTFHFNICLKYYISNSHDISQIYTSIGSFLLSYFSLSFHKYEIRNNIIWNNIIRRKLYDINLSNVCDILLFIKWWLIPFTSSPYA